MSESRQPALAPMQRDDLPVEVVSALRRSYSVGDWLSWERTPKGSSNVSFFVTTSSGRYVLRRSNPRKSAAAISFEVRLVDYLRKRGYPAPEVIKTRSGEGYAEHDGTLYVMTSFIPGSSYDPESPGHLLAAGRGLGLYHRLANDFSGPYVYRTMPDFTVIQPSIRHLAEIERLAGRSLNDKERRCLEDAFTCIRSQLIRVHRGMTESYRSLSKLVIQGSYGRSALIFDGDALVGVVDYDRATFEIRAIDLAYTVKAFCRIHDQQSGEYRVGLDYERCRELMTAYQEVEALPKRELQALPLIFRGQRLLKVLNKCENFLRKNAIVPQETKDVRKLATMAEREAVRVRWLEEHSGDLVAVLAD
ncbi:MAG TPA: phosphotransferase [Dehalococcoidia bacterium]|nr:phosphotransferase [Dehalococcoidia bacterium]HLB28882.1 phosphotransferase [Dehalococcoidia bacterium]